MKPGEKALAFIFLIFSITALFLSYNISGFKSMSSPGSFPMIVSIVMLLSAVINVRNVFRKEKEADCRERETEAVSTMKDTMNLLFPRTVVIFMLASLVYVILIINITFIYASVLYILFIGLYFKSKKFQLETREVIKIGVISVGTTLVVYFIFQEIFSVILP